MTTREQVEAEIRHLMATETSAVRFSNKLFTPGGLFSRLYSTPAEKKLLLDSPLFEEANRRLSELQRAEAERLERSAPTDVVSAVGTVELEALRPAEAKP